MFYGEKREKVVFSFPELCLEVIWGYIKWGQLFPGWSKRTTKIPKKTHALLKKREKTS